MLGRPASNPVNGKSELAPTLQILQNRDLVFLGYIRNFS
jgi:hypothetical protein